MKKKYIIALIVLVIMVSGIIIFIASNSKIKTGDVFKQAILKDELPTIKSKDSAGVTIADVNTGKVYVFVYAPQMLLMSTADNKNNTTVYAYSWEEFGETNNVTKIKKGWNIAKETKKKNYNYIHVDKAPIQSISGEVIAVTGNTSIIKKMFKKIK